MTTNFMKKSMAFLLALFLFTLGTSPVYAIAPMPEIAGEAAIVKSVETGLVLYGKNEIAKYPPSHLTKMMTALLAVQHYKDMSTQVIAKESAILEAKGLTNAKIVADEVLSVKDLLCMMLLPNAADAANVLAEDIAGDIPSFVALMNQKSSALGLTNTHFTNPHGAHEEEQYTTASDMAILCEAAMKNAVISEIADTQYKRIVRTNKTNSERYYFSNNALVISSSDRRKQEDYYYKYAVGTMTGVSNETGYSIAATMKKDNMQLIVIVLASNRDPQTKVKKHYTDAIQLADFAYENYQYALMLKEKEAIGEVEVNLSSTNDFITLVSTQEEMAIIPSDIAPKDMERIIHVNQRLEAPIHKDQVIGTVDFVHNGKVYATFNVASQAEVHRNQLLFFLDRVGDFLSGMWFKFTLFAIVGATVFYVFIMIHHNKKEKNRHRKRRPKPPKRYR